MPFYPRLSLLQTQAKTTKWGRSKQFGEGVPTFEVADRSENTTLVRKHSKGPALSKKHKTFCEETK